MKSKIISSIILLLVLIIGMILGGLIFKILMASLAIISIDEFIRIKETKKNTPILMRLLAILSVIFVFITNIETEKIIFSMDYRILSAIFLIFLIPTIIYHDRNKYSINDSFYTITGILLISIVYSLMVMLNNYNKNLLIYILLIGIITDTYSFITGKLIGNKKLLEIVSPNKTIEGMIGGIVMGTFIPVTYYMTCINTNANIMLIILITLLLSVIGSLGDLFFSSIKRYYNQKDFKSAIKENEGILDRFDSIIFIVYAFMFFINMI